MKTRFMLSLFSFEDNFVKNVEITYDDAYSLENFFSHIFFDENELTIFFKLKTELNED
jgi:hypothetical protein